MKFPGAATLVLSVILGMVAGAFIGNLFLGIWIRGDVVSIPLPAGWDMLINPPRAMIGAMIGGTLALAIAVIRTNKRHP